MFVGWLVFVCTIGGQAGRGGMGRWLQVGYAGWPCWAVVGGPFGFECGSFEQLFENVVWLLVVWARFNGRKRVFTALP
jgi:hypothetical protein